MGRLSSGNRPLHTFAFGSSERECGLVSQQPLTVEEVAKFMRVSSTTVRRATASTDADADTIEAIAQRVAERVAELVAATRPPRPPLVDTATVAEMIGVSTHWVRDHAAELGAFRVGDGAKGELRFDPSEVRAALERRRLRPLEPEVVRRRARPRRSPRNVDLLPLPQGARS